MNVECAITGAAAPVVVAVVDVWMMERTWAQNPLYLDAFKFTEGYGAPASFALS